MTGFSLGFMNSIASSGSESSYEVTYSSSNSDSNRSASTSSWGWGSRTFSTIEEGNESSNEEESKPPTDTGTKSSFFNWSRRNRNTLPILDSASSDGDLNSEARDDLSILAVPFECKCIQPPDCNRSQHDMSESSEDLKASTESSVSRFLSAVDSSIDFLLDTLVPVDEEKEVDKENSKSIVSEDDKIARKRRMPFTRPLTHDDKTPVLMTTKVQSFKVQNTPVSMTTRVQSFKVQKGLKKNDRVSIHASSLRQNNDDVSITSSIVKRSNKKDSNKSVRSNVSKSTVMTKNQIFRELNATKNQHQLCSTASLSSNLTRESSISSIAKTNTKRYRFFGRKGKQRKNKEEMCSITDTPMIEETTNDTDLEFFDLFFKEMDSPDDIFDQELGDPLEKPQDPKQDRKRMLRFRGNRTDKGLIL